MGHVFEGIVVVEQADGLVDDLEQLAGYEQIGGSHR